MFIYYIFLVMSLIVIVVSSFSYREIYVNGFVEQRGGVAVGYVFFGVVIFFCGLRSGIADTGTYIFMFKEWPSKLSQIDWSNAFSDKGFYLLTVLYKQFIYNHYQGWLFIIALISGWFVLNAFLKYSSDFGMSCFLFISGTTFVYLINGMRQFIVVSILFSCLDMILERQFFRYVILVVLLSTIHGSALIMIPFYFVYKIRPFSMQMWFIVIGVAVAGAYIFTHFALLSSLMEDTQYEGYVDLLANSSSGVNIFRLMIAAVPCFLAILGRQIIIEYDSEIVNISMIASFLTLALYFVAALSNGMVIGRVLIYVEVYNLLLLPWLINNIFERKSASFMKGMCVLFYVAFFYIQMNVTWHLVYESEVLHLFYY